MLGDVWECAAAESGSRIFGFSALLETLSPHIYHITAAELETFQID